MARSLSLHDLKNDADAPSRRPIPMKRGSPDSAAAPRITRLRAAADRSKERALCQN